MKRSQPLKIIMSRMIVTPIVFASMYALGAAPKAQAATAQTPPYREHTDFTWVRSSCLHHLYQVHPSLPEHLAQSLDGSSSTGGAVSPIL